MAHGGSKTWRVDIIDSFDPRIDGRAATKGTLFRYIPAVGDPILLIKSDEGFSTNWIPASGSGGGGQVPFVVDVASTANVNVAVAPATIDGVAYTTVLLKDQTLPEENGVYDFNGAGVPLTRNADWSTAADFVPGRLVYANLGATQANTLWENENEVVTLGTDPILFQEIAAGSFMLRNFSNSLPSTVAIDLGTHLIHNVVNPVAAQDAATKSYVDTADAGKMNTNFSNAIASTVPIDAGTHLIHNVVDPVAAQDAATKAYVDAAVTPPVGDPNTLAYFGAGGALTDNLAATFDATLNAMSFALIAGGATVTAGGNGSLAIGQVTGAGTNINAGDAGAFAHGFANAASLITAAGVGSTAQGQATGAASIQANDIGGFASGNASGAGSITASSQGSFAFGVAVGGTVNSAGFGSLAFGSVAAAAGTITANGPGSNAYGVSAGSGSIQALGDGSTASGNSQPSSSLIASGLGAFARGYNNDGDILASGDGSFASGQCAFGGVGILRATSDGSHAMGFAASGRIDAAGPGSFAMGEGANNTAAHGIIATVSASFAMGYCEGATHLQSNGIGSFAMGYAFTASNVTGIVVGFPGIGAAPRGSFALGYANENGSSLDTTLTVGDGVDGSFTFGYSFEGGSISSLANGAVMFCYAPDNVSATAASGVGSFTQGQGHSNSGFLTSVFGRFASITATPGAWVPAEPLFVLGNGANTGAPANAFQIDKDGRMTTTGAQIAKMRVVTVSALISARTDNKIVANDVAAGANTLTLPAGEEGLTFMLSQAATNTGTWTITPTGGDTLDANIQSIFNTSQPVPVTYDLATTTWYAV